MFKQDVLSVLLSNVCCQETEAGAAVGVQPPQVAARSRNVSRFCSGVIHDAACLLSILTSQSLKPRAVLRARALIDARARAW